MKPLLFAFALLLALAGNANADAPTTFGQAKVIAKQKVFFDQASSELGELYCGCKWKWVGKSGGRVDAASCGYETRKQQSRAERTEWEHIVPAWTFGHQRQCWQNGGRKQCESSDPIFRAMEADLFNLYPAVGEVNGDRANYNYGMAGRMGPQYGQCQTKIDFGGRTAEPRDEVKGLVARTTFYMFDRYGLNMSRQQQQLLIAWHKKHPVSSWEQQRNQRIAKIMGHSNPFVTGEREWTTGYRPAREGVVSTIQSSAAQTTSPTSPTPKTSSGQIIGNLNSRVYHLPSGCPSYDKVSAKNQVPFVSEVDARRAGYRKAGNCR